MKGIVVKDSTNITVDSSTFAGLDTAIELNRELEDEVIKIHSYEVPCVMAIPIKYVNKEYYEWLTGALDSSN